MRYANLAFNYGGQQQKDPYDLSGQVARDFLVLKSLGVTKLRISMPIFNAGRLPAAQDLVLAAMDAGFRVLWGATAGSSPVLTASRYATFRDAVLGLAAWAETHQLDEFSIGNEEELHVDDTTLTKSQLRANLQVLATDVQSVYTHGDVSYQTSLDNIADWAAIGLGGLDRIGFNLYGSRRSFTKAAVDMVAAFGNQADVTEWSTQNGYEALPDEFAWAQELAARARLLHDIGIPTSYYYVYRDADAADGLWPIVLHQDGVRQALAAITGMRPWYWPGQVSLTRNLMARVGMTHSTAIQRVSFTGT